LKVGTFYAQAADNRHASLWKGGEFALTDQSKITIRKVGKLEEFPDNNLYPPYWRYFETVEPKDIEIGMYFNLNLIFKLLFFSYSCLDP